MPVSSCRHTCQIICSEYESKHRELRAVAPFAEAEALRAASSRLFRPISPARSSPASGWANGVKIALVIERLLWEAPWLQRIWAAFEAKPVLAGAFGLAMCGLLISGVIYSEKGDVQPVALIPVAESGCRARRRSRMSIAENHPLLAKPAALEASSTNPITALQADGPLLGGLRAQPASFTFPGRN